MLRKILLLGCIGITGCNKSEGGDSLGSAMATSAAKTGSGGFSADLAKEMGVGGKGSAAGSAAKPDDKVAMAGSATGSAAKPPDTKPADTKPADTKPADTKPADTKPADTKPADTKPADTKPADTKAVKPADTKPADTKPADTKPADTKPADTKPADIKPAQTPVVEPTPAGPVKVPANLSAIKLSLLPNWDRDVGEAGTFQYVVRIKGTQNATKTFVFHYGYDDPRAPSDREQYKKFLLDQKMMSGELRDRQRGGAWFIEGADSSGAPAFRYVVLYGGKRLVCYGSLYKDAESNKLGDDRDQTIIQAKQICETLAL